MAFWLLRSGSYTSLLTHKRCSSIASFRATATTARFLAFFPPRAASFSPPSPQITVFSKGSQDVVRSLHQHGSQITVSFFADAHLRLALTGVPAPGAQTKKTADLATLWEPLRIFQGQDIRQRDLRSYPLHLFE